MFKARHLGFHVLDGGKDRQGFIANATLAAEGGLLCEQADAQTAKQNHLAAVGFFAMRQQAKDRRLAGAVATHQADALAGIDLQRHAAQDFVRAIEFVNVFEAEQHCGK